MTGSYLRNESFECQGDEKPFTKKNFSSPDGGRFKVNKS